MITVTIDGESHQCRMALKQYKKIVLYLGVYDEIDGETVERAMQFIGLDETKAVIEGGDWVVDYSNKPEVVILREQLAMEQQYRTDQDELIAELIEQ